jgi:hypothetical protein
MQRFTQQGKPKGNWIFPDSKARHSHRIARKLHHPTFLFGWLKTQLERIEDNGENELYEMADEILTGLSIDMTKMVFVHWMKRLQRLIDGNGDYVS